jgi:hypothetical protein
LYLDHNDNKEKEDKEYKEDGDKDPDALVNAVAVFAAATGWR